MNSKGGPNYAKLKITGIDNAFQVVARERTYAFSHKDVLEMMTFIQEWAGDVVKSIESKNKPE